jgi:hypothetical protein
MEHMRADQKERQIGGRSVPDDQAFHKEFDDQERQLEEETERCVAEYPKVTEHLKKWMRDIDSLLRSMPRSLLRDSLVW